jgi:hypothetical protein
VRLRGALLFTRDVWCWTSPGGIWCRTSTGNICRRTSKEEILNGVSPRECFGIGLQSFIVGQCPSRVEVSVLVVIGYFGCLSSRCRLSGSFSVPFGLAFMSRLSVIDYPIATMVVVFSTPIESLAIVLHSSGGVLLGQEPFFPFFLGLVQFRERWPLCPQS